MFTIIIRLWLLFLITFGLSGCLFSGKGRPSFLIIAVESLDFENVTCDFRGVDQEIKSGLDQLCQESVRFTHAYTPSPLSQATMASILTGKYPFEHGVWHNGEVYLSGKYKTVAEFAYEKNYRTSFFSGGAPIWRKSGLSQGFEKFDDNVPVSIQQIFRPAERVGQLFLRWLSPLPAGDPYFSMLYLADLQFPGYKALDKEGLAIESSRKGRLKALNNFLSHLRAELKRKKRWNNTYVILVGLNGKINSERRGEIRGTNLFSEATQVAMMVKPVQKERDLGVQWKIDANLTLVDLGETLFDLLGRGAPKKEGGDSERSVEVVSFREALESPKVTWREDRSILIESAWASWRGAGQTRFASRKSQFLLFYDQKLKSYNSLIDRRELQANLDESPFLNQIKNTVPELVKDKDLEPWQELPSSLREKLKICQTLWSDDQTSNWDEQSLIFLTQKRPWDRQVFGWLAMIAIERKDWKLLMTLGKRARVPEWQYVASLHLGTPFTGVLGNCSKYLMPLGNQRWKHPSPQQCHNPLFVSLLDWKHGVGDQKFRQRDDFFRRYEYYKLDEIISIENYRNGLFWDTAIDIPYEPSLADLYLASPHASKLRTDLIRKFGDKLRLLK